MNEEHQRSLERMYHAAPCNAYYQPRLSISEGAAEVVVPVRPDMFHAAGAIHGSVYFKVLDDAAFFAVSSIVPDVFVLTTSFNLHLLKPVHTGEIRAVGRVVHRSKKSFLAEAVATDSAGNEVARGTGSFALSPIALAGLPGRSPQP